MHPTNHFYRNDNEPFPSVSDVDRICNIEDQVLRNLQITQAYCELSKVVSKRTGTNANWCTFATWASKQAGVTIRGEDLRRRLEDVLKKELQVQEMLCGVSARMRSMGSGETDRQIHPGILRKMTHEVIVHAGEAVARGNKKVFQEIGREFARFAATILFNTEYNAESLAVFCSDLRDGDPPDGQDYLKRAFSRYYQSFFETNLKRCQELQLLANIEIGYHEQTRLQPEIAEALNAAWNLPVEVQKFISATILGNNGVAGKIIYFFSWCRGKKSLLNQAIEKLAHLVQLRVRMFITKEMMTLSVPPDITLRLGSDLTASFPENLLHLTNAELVTFLSTIDPTTDSLIESGASDWSLLKERLHYIADLFRCFHSSQDLFDAAFSDEQLLALKAGKIPAGRL